MDKEEEKSEVRTRPLSTYASAVPVIPSTMLVDAEDSSSPTTSIASETPSVTATKVKVPSPFDSRELIVLQRDPQMDFLAKQRFVTHLNVSKRVKEDREGTQHLFSTPETPRKYVPLKPGHSLMDWIRYTNVSGDLTGIAGRLIDVTEEELAKHNTLSDAWTCLKGKVYNITPYLEYHPGGVDILMSGAGKDSTSLFFKTHKWVNFESILRACLVGRMVTVRVPVAVLATRDRDRRNKRELQLLDIPNTCIVEADSDVTPFPRYDWYQTVVSLVIVIYTSCDNLNSQDIIVDLKQTSEILISIRVKKKTYLFHMELKETIDEIRKMKVAPNGKVEFFFTKTTGVLWDSLGASLTSHNSFLELDNKEPSTRTCKLIAKTALTHNVFAFAFQLPKGTLMQVPVAKHVILSLENDGTKISRSYTPVPGSLKKDEKNTSTLHFIIKVYEDGLFTPRLNQLELDSSIGISDYYGEFSEERLENVSHFVGLGAGTGITPIIGIVNHILVRSKRKCEEVCVMQFSKQQKDILWKDQFDELASGMSNFTIQYVLSEPSSDWNSHVGTVTKELLQEFVPMNNAYKKLICICGPTQFNADCLKLLEDMGVVDNELFIFSNSQL